MAVLNGYWNAACCGLQRLDVNGALMCMLCDAGVEVPNIDQATRQPTGSTSYVVVIGRLPGVER